MPAHGKRQARPPSKRRGCAKLAGTPALAFRRTADMLIDWLRDHAVADAFGDFEKLVAICRPNRTHYAIFYQCAFMLISLSTLHCDLYLEG